MGKPAAGRTRVMITVPDGLLARIDDYCGSVGLSRSGFINAACADKLKQEDISRDALSQLVDMLGGEALKDSASV